MSDSVSRKNAIINLLALPLAATAVAATIGTADAAATLDPKTVQYQDKPNNGHKCSGCALFVAPSACKQVKGKISPNGWCAIWQPAPAKK